MADFTMELWEVIDLEGVANIGLDDYPIFDETYRAHLNDKIIQHFLTREIGQESIGHFRLQLRRKMHEIMPYWNQHYLASQKTIDPLLTINYRTATNSEATGAVTGEGTNNSSSDAKSRAVASTLPQVMLSGNGDYAENAQDNVSGTTAEATTTESQNSTNSGNVDSETTGYQGNPAVLIAEWRATFVNTDMDVIAQLEPLFMGIFMTQDDYTTNGRLPRYVGYYGFSF